MTTEQEKDQRDLEADERDARAGSRENRAEILDERLNDRAAAATSRETKVTETEGFAQSSVTFLKFLVVVLIVISIGNFIRTYFIQDSAEKAFDAAEQAEQAGLRAEDVSLESRDVAIKTLDELHLILEELENGNENEPELKNQAIIDALAAVARIEGYICGGSCPDPEDR